MCQNASPSKSCKRGGDVGVPYRKENGGGSQPENSFLVFVELSGGGTTTASVEGVQSAGGDLKKKNFFSFTYIPIKREPTKNGYRNIQKTKQTQKTRKG